MVFARELRERVRSGEITTSIRIWMRAKVKVGGVYPLAPGSIVVESVEEIGLEEITEEMAIESGFMSVDDLLKTARHGRGERVYLIRFEYRD